MTETMGFPKVDFKIRLTNRPTLRVILTLCGVPQVDADLLHEHGIDGDYVGAGIDGVGTGGPG